MKAENAPVRPPTMMVPPFMVDAGAREPTSPLHTKSPPRIAAPKHDPAFFSIDRTVPDSMFSAQDQPDAARYAHVRTVDQANAEVSEAALEIELQTVEDADAEGMLGQRDS